MSGHAGFDRLTYPGDATMAWLWDNTNLAWTGFYLAPAPSQRYTGWMSKRNYLAGLGWGFAPIYVGQQDQGPGSHHVNEDQGFKDGANAATLAQTAGFPSGSVIFLDVEQGPPLRRVKTKDGVQVPALDYFNAWVTSLTNNNYWPGVYCSYLLADEFKSAAPDVQVWPFRLKYGTNRRFHKELPAPDPSSSGVPYANVWQLAQACTMDREGGKTLTPVDFDTADSVDPSSPPQRARTPHEISTF